MEKLGFRIQNSGFGNMMKSDFRDLSQGFRVYKSRFTVDDLV